MKISRRDFLIGAGAGVIITGAAALGYVGLDILSEPEAIADAVVVEDEPGFSINSFGYVPWSAELEADYFYDLNALVGKQLRISAASSMDDLFIDDRFRR